MANSSGGKREGGPRPGPRRLRTVQVLAVRGRRFHFDSEENIIELRQRLASGLERRFADTRIWIEQQLFRLLDLPDRNPDED